MPGKKRPASKTRSSAASNKKGRSRRARAPKRGESLLIDVARTVGTTLGALAARSSQAAESLRVRAKRKH